MRSKLLVIFALSIEAFILSPSVFAHHGYAAYNTEKTITLKGTVTDWAWANPHCVLELDVTDDAGHVVRWATETENPSNMVRQGWTAHSLKPGDQVTVTALPAKNGKPVGRIVEVVLPSGQKLMGGVIRANEIKPEDSPKQ